MLKRQDLCVFLLNDVMDYKNSTKATFSFLDLIQWRTLLFSFENQLVLLVYPRE